MRDELLKTVRLDRFYVGQNIGSSKVTVTDTGTERIGDVEAAALHLNVEEAEATWYVDRANGRLLRTVAKVPVMGTMVDSVVDYSDWRNCDGLMISFQRAITQGGKASQEKVLAVELNPAVLKNDVHVGLAPATDVGREKYQQSRTRAGLCHLARTRRAVEHLRTVTYYYVVTELNASDQESAYSTQVTAIVP